MKFFIIQLLIKECEISMEFKKIVINNRSRYIHHKDCESVKQMHQENKIVIYPKDTSDLEGYYPCGHCFKKIDYHILAREVYLSRINKLKIRREIELKKINERFDKREDRAYDRYLLTIEKLEK